MFEGIQRFFPFNSANAFFICMETPTLCLLSFRSHSFLWEQANAAQFGGIGYRPIKNLPDGTMDLKAVRCFVALFSLWKYVDLQWKASVCPIRT